MIINFALDTDDDRETIERVLRAILDIKATTSTAVAVNDIQKAARLRSAGVNAVFREPADNPPKRRGRKPKAGNGAEAEQ